MGFGNAFCENEFSYFSSEVYFDLVADQVGILEIYFVKLQEG